MTLTTTTDNTAWNCWPSTTWPTYPATTSYIYVNPVESKYEKAIRIVKVLMDEKHVSGSITVKGFLELVEKIEKLL